MACIGTLWRLVIVWTGWIEGSILADDAFYYFKIASNIAAGRGSTFDGLAPTNGYHPLWLWMLVPWFRAFGNSLWLPIQAAVTVSVLLDLATGLLLARLLGARVGRAGAWVAACFWFLSPFTVFLGLRGMEASLAAFLVLVILWRLDRALDRSGPTIWGGLGIGVLWGLAGLARTDNLPVVGVMLAGYAWLRVRLTRSAGFRGTFVWLAGAGAAALLVTLPWFLWNLKTFGSIVQVSGLMKLHYPIAETSGVDWSTPARAAATLANRVAAPLAHAARFVSFEEFAPVRLTWVSGGLLVAGFWLPWIAGGRRVLGALRGTATGVLLGSALAFMVAHTVLFGLIWKSYINWYALPYLALYALGIGAGYGLWLGLRPRRPARVAAVLAPVALFLLALTVRFIGGIELGPGFLEGRNAPRLHALAERYPQGVRAGAFNAGVAGYLAPAFGNITVINLDCLVNNRGYVALREGRYLQYLEDQVDVLLESPQVAWYLFRPAELDSVQAAFRQWPGLEVWSRDGSGAR